MRRLRALPARRRGQEHGVAAVEFAIVVIPLLMIVFGTIHFGVLMAQKAALNSAVRTGARFGSVNLYDSATMPHTCDATVSRAKDGSTTLGMDPNSVTWSVYKGTTQASAISNGLLCSGTVSSNVPPCKNAPDGTNLYVIADYTTSLIGIPFVGVNKTVSLESVGVFKCEYN